MTTPSITCPRCGMTSHNPNDIREGYCGNCHEYTGRQRRGRCIGCCTPGPGVCSGCGAYIDDNWNGEINDTTR